MSSWLRAAGFAIVLCLPGLASAIGSPSGPPADLVAAPAAAPPAAAAPVAVPEPSEEAIEYYQSGNRLWLARRAFGLAVPLFVLWVGLSTRMRDLAQRLAPHWLGTVAVFACLYTLLRWVMARPLAFYGGYLRPHAYGLSSITLAKWLQDSLVSLAVSTVVAVLVAGGLYACIRRFPRRWWLAATACLVPFTLFAVLVQPLWIAPLYNDFGPMQDEALEAKIVDLAERSGIEGSRVFEVDKSVQTKQLNAYVTGFLASKRIVLWDTLLARLDEGEVLFVMAHEMGHYVLDHVLLGVALGTLLSGLGLYLLQRILPPVLRRFGPRLGIDGVTDVAALPLLLFLIGLGSLLASPLPMAFSRVIEHEADRFALELTRDNHAAATAFVKLHQTNLSIPRPGPWYVAWRGSHPSLGDRIDFANEYRPWEHGEPLRYGDRFR